MMRLIRTFSLVFLVIASPSVARAGAYYIEGPHVVARGDARDQKRSLASDADPRVVRGEDASGDWFAVRVDAGTELAAARAAAARVAEQLGSASLYDGSGATGLRLLEFARVVVDLPASEAPDALAAGSGEVGALDEGADAPEVPESRVEIVGDDVGVLLRRAADGLGGDGAASALASAGSVVFAFRREQADGLVTSHLYARRGADRYLSVDVRAGGGVSSVSRVVGDGAWLTDVEGTRQVDADRTREVVDWFAPEGLLPFIFGFPTLVRDRPALRVPDAVDVASRDGRTVVTFAYAASEDVGAVRGIEVDLESGALLGLAVATKEGNRRLTVGVTRSDGPLVWPNDVTFYFEDRVAEVILVDRLEIDGAIDAPWFTAPGAP